MTHTAYTRHIDVY